MVEMEALDFLKELKRMCDSHNKLESRCNRCPLHLIAENDGACFPFIKKYPEKAIEVVEEWSKEHPIKTNADKFKEVFGYDISKNSYSCSGISCPTTVTSIYSCSSTDCPCYGFWDKPYKEEK